MLACYSQERGVIIMKDFITWLVGLAAIIWLMNIAGQVDQIDEEIAGREYCNMVELFEDSAGEYGWPPYRDDVQCPTVD